MDKSSGLNAISGDVTFVCVDRTGNDCDSTWYLVLHALQALRRVCVAFSDSSRLVHFSVANEARYSSFESFGCHFLLNIFVMAENLFATFLYVTFRAGESEKWQL